MNNSIFSVLKDKRIVEILDGDSGVGKNALSMPYLTKRDIKDVANKFGIDLIDNVRWKMMYTLIDEAIHKERIQEIISFLFSKSNFMRKTLNCTKNEFDFTYINTVSEVIKRINGLLEYQKFELTYDGESVNFVSKEHFQVSTCNIEKMNNQYVITLSKKLKNKVNNQDLDSAVTESRTLLEEVMIHLLEEKGEENKSKGNLRKLYNQVKELYSMCTDKQLDTRINKLLSGLESIVTAISEIRNNYSDSHGVGSGRKNIKDYHALLVVNSAITMSEFLLSVMENQNKVSR